MQWKQLGRALMRPSRPLQGFCCSPAFVEPVETSSITPQMPYLGLWKDGEVAVQSRSNEWPRLEDSTLEQRRFRRLCRLMQGRQLPPVDGSATVPTKKAVWRLALGRVSVVLLVCSTVSQRLAINKCACLHGVTIPPRRDVRSTRICF